MDDTNKKSPQDAVRINVNEEHEVRYWTKKFNVSRETLESAVEKVGVMVQDVESYLKEVRP